MVTIQFFDENGLLLSQLRKDIPVLEQEIKIKGKKGKVISVSKHSDTLYHINVQLDKVVKASALAIDKKKKRK